MTDSTRYVGPRGWAALVLASGAALSAPFLRNAPVTGEGNQAPSGNAPAGDFNSAAWPAPREKALGAVAVASHLSEQDWAELMRLNNHSGATPRKVTGELPSTSPNQKLPSWADRGPQVDQLVNESIRSEPLPPTAPTSSKPLEPMRPWVEGVTQRQSISSGSNQAVGDYVLAKPDPDARWRQEPSFGNTPDSGAVVSKDAGSVGNKLLNESPASLMWPSAPQRQFATLQSPATSQPAAQPQTSDFARNSASPEVPWPSTAGTTRPIGNASTVPSTNAVAIGSGASETPAVMPLPTTPVIQSLSESSQNTVSAPMVSSQSMRPAIRPPHPGLNNPTIHTPAVGAPKPNEPAQRPKHFIQQPAKRA